MLFDANSELPTAEEALDAAYKRIVKESGADGLDRARAEADAADEVSALIDRGEVAEPNRFNALVKIVRGIDSRQGAAADRIIERLALGEVTLSMEDDPTLDTVVTLGSGRRKSWRYVTVADLELMDEERNRNFKAVSESFKKWKADLAVVKPAVLAYGTVGSAVRAEAFAGGAAA